MHRLLRLQFSEYVLSHHSSNITKAIFQSAAEDFKKDDVSEVAEKLFQAISGLDYTLLALDNDGH
jgi:hypothetical protein